MSHPFRREIQKFRAMVFGYTLFFIAGYESKHDFAMWCDRRWRARHPLLAARSTPSIKWFDLLEGAWLREDPCRRELKEDFPALRVVEDNPLWTVLDWENIPFDTADVFIQRVRMNGVPLFPFSEKMMETLCGCPDWTRLAYLVALLRTRDLRYLTHRLWLRKNFSCYVKLVCLTTPCCACCDELYQQLHALYLLGRLGAVDHWPMDPQAFHEALERQELLGDALAESNWFHEWDTYSVTMLWCVAATHRLLVARFAQGQYDCPPRLSKQVHDTLSTHAKTLITLAD
jgi:hypothetical protein